MKSVLIAAGFSIGGADSGNRTAPGVYRRSALRFRDAIEDGGLVWQCRAHPRPWPECVPELRDSVIRLARMTARLRHRGLPVIMGGDHSCAIGTWTGLSGAGRKPPGLLWIDAHLDSHTPMTSLSGRVHGMPLALLLGEGDPRLRPAEGAVIDPRHTVVLGVRSHEPGEAERLNRLGVRLYDMAEIRRRGLFTCMREAWQRVSSAPHGFGVSLDLDALDPSHAPAVSVREPGGLPLPGLVRALAAQPRQRLLGIEIVEYNPTLDQDRRTQRALTTLLDVLLS